MFQPSYGNTHSPLPMNDHDLASLVPTSPGIYRHYKGMLYEVLATVRHSETLEAMTLYRALYGERGLWVRPAAMFAERVLVDGAWRPRFERCAQGVALPPEVEAARSGSPPLI